MLNKETTTHIIKNERAIHENDTTAQSRFDYRQVSLRTPMALESNSWLTTNNTSTGASNREQQQQQQQHSGVVKAREDQLGQVGQHGNQNFVTEDGQQRGLLKIPTSVIGKCSMFTQTEHTNRFTQTDHPGVRYSGNCLEPGNNSINCKAEPSAMFVPSSIQQPSANTQMYGASNEKNKETDKGSNNSATEFPFCYNVNMLQKVHQQQGNAGVPVGGISGDDKGCYRFDVAQPFGYNYALVNQMSLAAAASTATFKCDVCGLVFTHLSLLNHHKRIHNTPNVVNTGTQSTNNERQFSCDICGAGFNLAGELKSHKNGMHGKNNQNTGNKCCNSCGVELSCDHHSGGLLKAKKIGKFVKCESCPEMSSSGNVSGTSYSGSNSSGSEGNGPTPVPSSTGPVEIKPGHHPVKLRGVASVTKCHKCNGSGIIFIGGARNSTGVDKPFHCNVCDGTFSRYSSLWSHKRLHSGDKPFKCEICGLAFAKAAYLKNHGRVHTGEKPFKCAVCGMQFSQSPHLKNHERIHSGERPYQCEVCDKTFARHSTLWNHRRIHTGEKPYRCEVCGSAFNQATHLKNHAKVHTGEKPHRCDICDCGFSDRFALKRHRGIHEKYGRTSASNNSSNAANNSQSASQVTANTTNVNVNSVTNVNPVNTVSVSDVNNGNNANQNTNNPQPGMDEFMRSIHEKYGRAPTTNSSNNTTNSSPNSNQVSSNAANVNTVNVNSVGNVNPVNSVSDVNNTSNANPNGSNPQAGMDEFMRSIHEKYGRTPASNASSNPTNNNQNANQVAANTTNVNVNSVNVNSVNSVNPVSNVSVGDVNNRSNTNPNSNNPQTGMDELYKCEVGGPIAFPGCSRPHDEKQ